MKKYLIAPIASAIAIIGFFSPWMSCGMMTYSGIDLASGNMGGDMGAMGGASAGSESGGDALLFAIPLAALAIIGLYFLFKNKARLASAMVPTIIIAVLAVFVLGLKYIDVQNLKSEFNKDLGGLNSLSADSASSGTSGEFGAMMGNMISIKWGYWLTALGFLLSIYGAMQYRDLPKTPEDITTPGTLMESEPPGEVVSSEPPPDASMTEDKGMG